MLFRSSTSGIITRIAGAGIGYGGDGGQATDALLKSPRGICVDSHNNIFVCDAGNDVVRKINSSGIISTIAGNYSGSASGTYGGQATSVLLSVPTGICVDASGNVFISEEHSGVVDKVDASGIITLYAGDKLATALLDSVMATVTAMFEPGQICLDATGNLYISTPGDDRVRKVTPSGMIYTVTGTGIYSYTGDGGLATAATFQMPAGVCTDGAGNVYVSDYIYSVIRKIDMVHAGVRDVHASAGSSFIIFPNPASGMLTIEMPLLKGEKEIQIFDLAGKEIGRAHV